MAGQGIQWLLAMLPGKQLLKAECIKLRNIDEQSNCYDNLMPTSQAQSLMAAIINLLPDAATGFDRSPSDT